MPWVPHYSIISDCAVGSLVVKSIQIGRVTSRGIQVKQHTKMWRTRNVVTWEELPYIHKNDLCCNCHCYVKSSVNVIRRKPVKPPATLVLLSAIAVVAVIIPVSCAKLHSLVAGPPLDLRMITARESVPCVSCVCTKLELVMVLKRQMR